MSSHSTEISVGGCPGTFFPAQKSHFESYKCRVLPIEIVGTYAKFPSEKFPFNIIKKHPLSSGLTDQPIHPRRPLKPSGLVAPFSESKFLISKHIRVTLWTISRKSHFCSVGKFSSRAWLAVPLHYVLLFLSLSLCFHSFRSISSQHFCFISMNIHRTVCPVCPSIKMLSADSYRHVAIARYTYQYY